MRCSRIRRESIGNSRELGYAWNHIAEIIAEDIPLVTMAIST